MIKKNEEFIFIEIEKILDEWDPIGILQGINSINYNNGLVGEYSKYVLPLIQTYVNNQSLYDYLIKLQSNLWIFPDDEMQNEIKSISEKIDNFLSQYNIDELKKILERD
jgi:hypothetical protein